MKRTDIKIGQKVSFYFSGSKTKEREVFFLGEARTVHGIVHKIHRVNVEVWETLKNGSCTFYKKPPELTTEKEEATITPRQQLQLKKQLAERTKIRRHKEDARRQHIYK